MKLPDTNVLIYAVNTDAPQHGVARAWMAAALAAPAGVGFAWVALLGFVRICTHPSVLQRPLRPADAFEVLHFWLGEPRARVLHPTATHATTLGALLARAGTAGNLCTDAHLATLAIEHGATLASFDHDFHRFDALAFERLRAD